MALQGGDHLESVMWRNNQTGLTEEHKIRHVFLMTGADPNTGWLNGCLALDARSFIKTGPDLSPENLSAATLAPSPSAILIRNQFARGFCCG